MVKKDCFEIPSGFSHPQAKLQTLLDSVTTLPQQRRFEAVGLKPMASMNPFEKLRYASQAFLSGALPNAETLMFIASCIEKYVQREGEGSFSLDEAFELKSKSGKGNSSKISARDNTRNALYFEMACILANNQAKTRTEAANMAIDRRKPDHEYTVAATLVRHYKNNGWHKIEEILRRQQIK